MKRELSSIPIGSAFPFSLTCLLFQTFTVWPLNTQLSQDSLPTIYSLTLPEEQQDGNKHHFPIPPGHHSLLTSSRSSGYEASTLLSKV